MLTPERPYTSIAIPLAPLPSLPNALARRTAIFGPVEVEAAPGALRGLLLGGADALDVLITPVRTPFSLGRIFTMGGGRTDVGDGMTMLGEDVPSAGSDATLRLALDHRG